MAHLVQIFLTLPPAPHLQPANKEYEKKQKTGGCYKKKTEGTKENISNVSRTPGHVSFSLQSDREIAVFPNTADEVTAQVGKEAYFCQLSTVR